MRSTRAAIVCSLLLVGCGETRDVMPPVESPAPSQVEATAGENPAPSPSVASPMIAPDEVEHFVLEHEEIFYVRDESGPQEMVASDVFRHIEIHATLGGFELRALDEAGEPVLDWTSIEASVDDLEPAAIERHIELERPAVRMEIRSSNAIEFARFAVSQDAHSHEGDDPDGGGMVPLVSRPGRWIPPADVLELANQQSLPYSGAPSSCSGTFLPGTREFADFLKAEFEGATSYGGYACRANTANTSQLSVHASGRAIDLFVPLHNGDADNDLGDPIANYLIMNAQELGIEFVVWDRTSWGAHRPAPKHRDYTGPHPHHDHLHIELSPTAANTTGRPYPSILRDDSPIGYLDSASCDGINGWAQDPDIPDRPIEVYISIGGPIFSEGAVGYFVPANRKRDDLCAAIGSCEHAYHLPLPRGLMDGVEREVHVYGIDGSGGENSELANAGRTVRCDPPALPYPPEYGIKRHVPNAEVLNNWAFDRNDIAKGDSAAVAALPVGRPLSERPVLARAEGRPEVWLLEGTTRRHVPNAAAMETWRFDWEAIQAREEVSEYIESVPVTARPFLVRGDGPEVYLVEPPPALWADEIVVDGPTALGRGQTAAFTVTMRNRGAVAWNPESFEVRADASTDCATCANPLSTIVEPGQTTTLIVEITAPTTTGQSTPCVELYQDGFAFAAEDQGGPTDAICASFEVVDAEVELDDDEQPQLPAIDYDERRYIEAKGGCSSAPVAPNPAWLLIAAWFGWVRRRR